MIEKYGQLRLTDDSSGASVAGAYVKVYAKDAGGTVRFHKDGYTDLRGRFDYVSQSNNSIDAIPHFIPVRFRAHHPRLPTARQSRLEFPRLTHPVHARQA